MVSDVIILNLLLHMSGSPITQLPSSFSFFSFYYYYYYSILARRYGEI